MERIEGDLEKWKILDQFESDARKDSARASIDPLISMSRIPMDFETAALKIMMSRSFQARTRFQMAVRFVISQVECWIFSSITNRSILVSIR